MVPCAALRQMVVMVLNTFSSRYVVGQILSGQNRDDVVKNIHDYLSKIAESVNNNLVPLSHFVITKSITKRLQDYPNGSNLPHVHVAQQMLKLVFSSPSLLLSCFDPVCMRVCVPGNARMRGRPDSVRDVRGRVVVENICGSALVPPVDAPFGVEQAVAGPALVPGAAGAATHCASVCAHRGHRRATARPLPRPRPGAVPLAAGR